MDRMARLRAGLLSGVLAAGVGASFVACELVVGITDSPPLTADGAGVADGGGASDGGASVDGGPVDGDGGPCTSGPCAPKLVVDLDGDPIGVRVIGVTVLWAERRGDESRLGRLEVTTGAVSYVQVPDVAAFAAQNTNAFYGRPTGGDIFRCDAVACSKWVTILQPPEQVLSLDVAGAHGRVAMVGRSGVFSFRSNNDTVASENVTPGLADFPLRVAVRAKNASDADTAWISEQRDATGSFRVSQAPCPTAAATPHCVIHDQPTGAAASPFSGDLLFTSTSLYFTIAREGSLYRCTATGTCSKVASGLANPVALATDQEFLYISESAAGRVSRIPVGSAGPPEAVITGKVGVGPLGVSQTSVYVTTSTALGAPKAQLFVAPKIP